ncbi:MAG: squalene synthase HpnD [Betaproteobacteria bacterium RIFCSPLOWO2_02_FULL_66_14]|nr:MAG: squalene synthase HpnD [Betaproteobacteria bacterium RIFCSPLOWO2_02_FULL_66_14]
MSPDEYCRQKAAASGSSFYYAFLFLPPERRRAITALYAFCREVDDAVDAVHEPQVSAAKLAWWRNELGNLFSGRAEHPVAQALQPALEPFGITQERLGEIISGMEMDLTQTRYLDFAALEHYCYLVAGAVGLLAAGIFGYRDPRTLDYARTLGTAFQLTNIVRDVGEDARKGRIYLPLDDLRRFDVSAEDILRSRPSEAFRALMAFQAQRADTYYAQALAALPAVDRRAQRPGLIMAAIYRTLLAEIARDDFRVLTHRTSLTPLRKLWIAWKTWLTGRVAA